MPIKQIQLRGISRTPSDRMTADGGCAESLNVHMDTQELAPSLAPKDITNDILGEETQHDEIIYIHKYRSYTNYIGKYIGEVEGVERLCISAYTEDGYKSLIASFDPADEIKSVNSIGNTLIIATEQTIGYVLYKNGNYNFLGSEIPIPEVKFSTTPHSIEGYTRQGVSKFSIPEDSALRGVQDSGVFIQTALEGYGSEDTTCTVVVDGFTSLIRDNINEVVRQARKDKVFCFPVLARYALRLYDGSYIYQSAPILLTAAPSVVPSTQMLSDGFILNDDEQDDVDSRYGTSSVMNYLLIHYYTTSGHYILATAETFMLRPFTASYEVSTDYSGWEDIVQSVEVFISEDLRYPSANAKLEAAGYTKYLSSTNVYLEQQDGQNDTKNYEEQILSKGNFYLYETHDLSATSPFLFNMEPLSQDLLVVKRRLEDGEAILYRPIGESIMYNERLILSGALAKYIPSNCEPNYLGSTVSTPSRTRVEYHIHGEDGRDYYVTGWIYTGARDNIMAFLAYQNPRCFAARVFLGDRYASDYAQYFTVPMKEHPSLNCAYYFNGADKKLTDDHTPVTNHNEEMEHTEGELRNQLFMSETSNPFVFPFSGRQGFQDDIVGSAAVTVALSTGQFGDQDIYTFTKGGIYALSLSRDGSIAASHPLSRDVALPGTISPIDQAIVFVSQKGVMLLQGSSVTNLSPFMNGEHYALEADASSILSSYSCPWREYVSVLADTTPFMAFMKGAKITYDYAGSRLIAFNNTINSYQYVYDLVDQTWHKISFGSITDIRLLNSYPNAYVSCKKDNSNIVLDYSTFLDVTHASTEPGADKDIKGVIVTRPLDLGEPDVRKVIKSIRIRGKYNKVTGSENVKYLLLGSMDGLHFGVLHSLRHGSYKLFRLILLTKLSEIERVSWIDIDYETRFTNKLR